MALKLFSTLSRKKEIFTPLQEGKVGMYVCGPTVYDKGHLGHARSAVAFDIVRRYLLYKKYKVTFVFNYTDIDDKILQQSEKRKISWEQLIEEIMPLYDADYKTLGVLLPTVNPRATKHIKEMVDLIKILEKKNHTYVLDDGVYFDISTAKKYGELSRQNIGELQAGARVEVDGNKRNPQDFVLWKFKKPGEPSWKSPWGEGRPGWHIECSAMTLKHLGETFDIHGGGQDLIFPHHEDELTQSEHATGKLFAKYWMHNGFVTVDNEKMSKSLGNFFTIQDILKKYDPQVVRYYLMSTHYRSPINFSDKLLDAAKNSLMRIHEFLDNLDAYRLSSVRSSDLASSSSSSVSLKVGKLIEKAQKQFERGMDDDFETTVALAAVFDFIRDVNTFMAEKKMSLKDAKSCLVFMHRLDGILMVMKREKIVITKELQVLLVQREKARKEKDWLVSDKIRDQLKKAGFAVDDTEHGQKLRKI